MNDFLSLMWFVLLFKIRQAGPGDAEIIHTNTDGMNPIQQCVCSVKQYYKNNYLSKTFKSLVLQNIIPVVLAWLASTLANMNLYIIFHRS